MLESAMLELAKILRDIDNLGRERAELFTGIGSELETAEAVIRQINADLDAANHKIEAAKTSWLTTTFQEPPDKVYALPNLPEKHAIVAVDGSQIMPDKHEVTLCYLLNAAYIILYYGTSERPISRTVPKLCYRDEDLMVKPYGNRQVRVNDRILSIRRTLTEGAALQTAIQAAKASGIPVVALWDGSLIQWTFESEPPDYREKIVGEYLQALDMARELGIPVAGYISDPGSRDFINSMRIMLCDQEIIDCDMCPHAEAKPCDAVAHLKDSIVCKTKLNDGTRSALFTSKSSILERYREHEIKAFYMNAGREIVRIEVPEWVASDQALVDLTHAACYDQANKGRGYPIALAEAHEHAVIHGPDRKAFFEMVERSFAKHGARISLSLKRQSKGW
ncbi:MAG TPA: DNA double-strand break repair nuclease NurA [Armatimonadota bacterium]|nr:DNA double-strand break repair nuclease NurA [Armatimonadota bacterium]